MAKLPAYNPLPDIMFLAQRVTALESQVDYLKQRINIPTIIDKGEGDLEVIYDIDNGSENKNNIQNGDSEESLLKKPRGSGKQKKRNNTKDTGAGEI